MIPVSWAGAIAGALWHTVMAMVAAWSFSITMGTVMAGCGSSWRPLGLGKSFWAAVLIPLATSGVMAVVVRLSLTLLGLSGTRLGFIVGTAVGAVSYAGLAWFTMHADLTRAARLLTESACRRRSQGSS